MLSCSPCVQQWSGDNIHRKQWYLHPLLCNFNYILQTPLCKLFIFLSIALDNFVFLQAKTIHKHTKKNRAFFGAILIVLFPVSPKQRSNPLPVEP